MQPRMRRANHLCGEKMIIRVQKANHCRILNCNYINTVGWYMQVPHLISLLEYRPVPVDK